MATPTKPIFVVTGTGRSGTGWIARALGRTMPEGTRVGHEGYYKPMGMTKGQCDIDVSWCAVPYLVEIPGSILVTRDPADCIPSLLTTRLFDSSAYPTLYRKFLQRHWPEYRDYDDPIERACHFWIDWNTKALERVRFPAFKFEDILTNSAVALEFGACIDEVIPCDPIVFMNYVDWHCGKKVNDRKHDYLVSKQKIYDIIPVEYRFGYE